MPKPSFSVGLRHGIDYAFSPMGVVWGTVKRDEKKMRTLLRQTDSGLYFQGPDKWTPSASAAHNFKMIDRALDFVSRFHLHDLELVFAFDDAEEVTTVPIDRMELRYSES